MIAAIIVISLISLLVATDPEAEGSSDHIPSEPPLRPEHKSLPENSGQPDKLAA